MNLGFFQRRKDGELLVEGKSIVGLAPDGGLTAHGAMMMESIPNNIISPAPAFRQAPDAWGSAE